MLASLAAARWATGADLPACITKVVNPERRRRGLPLYPILPGAYLDL